jgi:hypothetical protein
MKIKTLLTFLILVLAVLVIAGSCASDKKAIDASTALKLFYGDWVNTDNEGYTEINPQRYVINPDNMMDIYTSATDVKPSYRHEITDVLESWIDRNENTFARVRVWCHTNGGVRHYLLKIDKSGNILEMNYVAGENPPPETCFMNPDLSTPNYYYNIYYRQ